MNLTPTVHNVVMIGIIAVLVILALRLAAKSPAETPSGPPEGFFSLISTSSDGRA